MTALRRALPDELAIFALALVARLGVIVVGGGLFGTFTYDPAVYYAASDALVHGRAPYRDFVFLHPPGVMLALAPFATLGRLTSDHTGFAVAALGFAILGSINAVLVVRVATRMGLSRRAALLGGAFYAVWLGSIGAEYTCRLEPLGNFLLLCGLLAFFASSRRSGWLCGLALGAAVCVKIWWIVPLAVIAVASRRRAPAVLGGAAAAGALIAGPFFALAPNQMWRMVISEQMARERNGTQPWARLSELSSVQRLDAHLGRLNVLVALVLLVIAVLVARSAWRTPTARPIAVLTAAQLLVLALAPSWFPFYADYATVPLALILAAAAQPLRSARRVVPALAMASVIGAAAASGLVLARGPAYVLPFPQAPVLAEAVENDHCLMSDSPMALIALDSLSRDLGDGCQNWVDVTGRTYGADRPPVTAHGTLVERRRYTKWQRDLRAYLLSGNSVIIMRGAGTGINAATMADIARGGVEFRDGRFIVYRG